jgi:hypothetical protein
LFEPRLDRRDLFTESVIANVSRGLNVRGS